MAGMMGDGYFLALCINVWSEVYSTSIRVHELAYPNGGISGETLVTDQRTNKFHIFPDRNNDVRYT